MNSPHSRKEAHNIVLKDINTVNKISNDHIFQENVCFSNDRRFYLDGKIVDQYIRNQPDVAKNVNCLVNKNSVNDLSASFLPDNNFQSHDFMTKTHSYVVNNTPNKCCRSGEFTKNNVAESHFIVDSFAHNSDIIHRNSTFIESDVNIVEEPSINSSFRTTNTTRNMLTSNENVGQRFSVIGLSGRYLVHQPYSSQSVCSSSRLSLGSMGPNCVYPYQKKPSVFDSLNRCNDYSYMVIFDYEAHTGEEVSAHKGDQIRILDNRYIFNVLKSIQCLYLYCFMVNMIF